ncbi:HMA2 domain-containing protein [Nostoc sp.]|uniref:HMA2 domain-containing protein n=1 Tax=Nostoc sp. TaxID=1180 RepID=UPI002FFCF9C3
MTKTISSREKLSASGKISSDLISTQQSNKSKHITTKAMTQATQSQPSGGLEIVHVTTGRVRLRTTDSSLNSILDSIAQDLRSLEGVREVTVNEQTGSLVVNFDEDKLSLPQILALKSDIEIQQPQASFDSASKTDPFAAWKSPSFWKEQGISLIPMMTGLAVTGGLGIHGWVSIPVYMIAADATRGVIGYLGSQVPTSEKNEGNNTSSAIKSDISESTIQPENSKVAAPAKIDYSVVHAIGGRIRFNVPKIAQDRAYGRRLERIVKTDAQVTSVRINFGAASIAIAYQSRDIPLSYWVSLMELALEINPPTLGMTTTKQPLEEVSQTPEITNATTTNHTTPVSQTAEVTDATTANHTTTVSQTAEVTDVTTANQTTPQLSSLWSSLKSPAMSLSLGMMANLPLET